MVDNSQRGTSSLIYSADGSLVAFGAYGPGALTNMYDAHNNAILTLSFIAVTFLSSSPIDACVRPEQRIIIYCQSALRPDKG